MKRLLVLFALIFILPISVSAENSTYSEQYETSGVSQLEGTLDENTKRILDENGVDPSDENWVNSVTGENVFTHIWNFLKSGAKKPIKAGAVIIGIILLTAAASAFGAENQRFMPALYAGSLAVTAVVASDVWSAVSAATAAIKGSAAFMLSFVPVFSGIVIFSGAAVSGVAMSALLLAAAQGVSAVASFGVLPAMGGYLALSISTGVSPLLNQSGTAALIKKAALWILSFTTTIFIGILSIQTAVNASADSLSLRTAKFIIGTSVPVAGAALSEAVSTITASVSLLRSSVGIYGVVVLAVIMIPIIAELILWRIVMLVGSSVSGLFSLPKVGELLKSVDMMLSVLLAIALTVTGMFIISLMVVVTAVKT